MMPTMPFDLGVETSAQGYNTRNSGASYCNPDDSITATVISNNKLTVG